VVWSGGVANGTVVNGRGSFDFIVGASAAGDVINDGTEFVVSGGFSSGTIVNSGGVEAVYDSGSEALNDFIYPGCTELVSAGGTAVGSIVKGGGVCPEWRTGFRYGRRGPANFPIRGRSDE
jgi:autotransporter passenger strand-loop-strand repeat protein